MKYKAKFVKVKICFKNWQKIIVYYAYIFCVLVIFSPWGSKGSTAYLLKKLENFFPKIGFALYNFLSALLIEVIVSKMDSTIKAAKKILKKDEKGSIKVKQ